MKIENVLVESGNKTGGIFPQRQKKKCKGFF